MLFAKAASKGARPPLDHLAGVMRTAPRSSCARPKPRLEALAALPWLGVRDSAAPPASRASLPASE